MSFIDQYNEQLRTLFEVVDRYKELTNRFLNDSGKKVAFAPDERLVIMLPNGDIAPLISLSSGERQIVVILTHLAFNKRAHEANVLSIDEPEIFSPCKMAGEFRGCIARCKSNHSNHSFDALAVYHTRQDRSLRRSLNRIGCN